MTSTLDIQRRLIALGYDLGPGKDDGIMGRGTTKAIARFQSDRELPILYPGTLGPNTLAALGLDQKDTVIPPWILEEQRKLGLHAKLNNAALKARPFLTIASAGCHRPSRPSFGAHPLV